MSLVDHEAAITAQLLEMLDSEVMCLGNNNPVRTDCGKPAVLRRTFFHDCPVDGPRDKNLKCVSCYTTYITHLAKVTATHRIRCQHCGQTFDDADGFVRYGPL